MNRILIINPFGIGDVIFSTPLIEILRKNFPDSYIGYVCNSRTSKMLQADPCLNRIFLYEKDDFREAWRVSKAGFIKKLVDFFLEIKKDRFDAVIDLSLGYQFSMLLGLIGIKKRVGFDYRNRGKFLTHKTPIDGFSDKHVVEYYLDLLRPFGVDGKKYGVKPMVYILEKDRVWADSFLEESGARKDRALIGIVPGCGASWGADAKFRRWDAKNFARVADRLSEIYDADIILFGDSKETDICRSVQEAMKRPPIISCGKTTVGGFLALLERCRIVITNDGGPLHMAVGLGVKTVSIFGPVDEKVYGPYPPSANHVVVSCKDLPCRPCYKKFKHNVCDERVCLSRISPEEVVEAARKLMV